MITMFTFAQAMVALLGFVILMIFVYGFFFSTEEDATEEFTMALEETESEYLARKAGYYDPLF